MRHQIGALAVVEVLDAPVPRRVALREPGLEGLGAAVVEQRQPLGEAHERGRLERASGPDVVGAAVGAAGPRVTARAADLGVAEEGPAASGRVAITLERPRRIGEGVDPAPERLDVPGARRLAAHAFHEHQAHQIGEGGDVARPRFSMRLRSCSASSALWISSFE